MECNTEYLSTRNKTFEIIEIQKNRYSLTSSVSYEKDAINKINERKCCLQLKGFKNYIKQNFISYLKKKKKKKKKKKLCFQSNLRRVPKISPGKLSLLPQSSERKTLKQKSARSHWRLKRLCLEPTTRILPVFSIYILPQNLL